LITVDDNEKGLREEEGGVETTSFNLTFDNK
jgi:hypothetical protein